MEPSRAPETFLKPFNAAEAEPKMLALWEAAGYANPDRLPNSTKGPYSIVLPPPNVTGTLHMGSALMLAIEDIMVRFARMSGKRTVWIPGTDHAAIATQAKVEKILEKEEGKRKQDLGREEFLKRVSAFAQSNHDTMI